MSFSSKIPSCFLSNLYSTIVQSIASAYFHFDAAVFNHTLLYRKTRFQL